MSKANNPAQNNKTTISRPPIVVIMGHIDHGKSTLLDYIRKTNIVAKEAGGITQHLGAYEAMIETANGKRSITFLDTPGHSAFCGIRERGASVADIAVLVVSAEDGVKPQTIEAFSCIKSSNIPYIVAINKIDKPNANIERTKQSLAEHEIYLEGYGGNIPWVGISALKGTGINELLELIILVGDMNDFKASNTGEASGYVLETNIDKKKGIKATLIVKEGELKSGSFVIASNAFAPIRIMENSLGKNIKSALPGMPVEVYGWNTLPPVGASFENVLNKKEAEKMLEIYKNNKNQKPKDKIEENNEKPILPIIIKADTAGSLEGIIHEINKLDQSKVGVKILEGDVGAINEANVKSAYASPNTLIFGFNVNIDPQAKSYAERIGVDIKIWNIIYELIDFIKSELEKRIPKIMVEEITGNLKILQTFSKEKDKQVVGGKVVSGVVKLGAEVRIIRRSNMIGLGRIRELQQQKKRTNEVLEGFECGLLIESKIEIAIGDSLEVVIRVEK